MEKELDTQRTRIEDLEPVGEELTEEHLRLVSGGTVVGGGFGPGCPGGCTFTMTCTCCDTD
jgi:hypothetical protein